MISPGACGEGVITELAHVTEALDGESHPVHRPLVLPRLRLGPEHEGAVRLSALELSRSVIPPNVRLKTLLAINLQILWLKPIFLKTYSYYVPSCQDPLDSEGMGRRTECDPPRVPAI